MKNALPTLLVSLAIICGCWILGSYFLKSKRDQSRVSVTGLATRDFGSDLIVWTGNFTRRAFVLQEAFNQLKTDQQTIRQYLIKKGIKENELVFSSVDIGKDFNQKRFPDGSETSEFGGYRLTQRLTIESREIDKVDMVSREITELINEGIEMNSDAPRYYFTKLADLKIDLLAAAAKDARIRAEKIAENAGADLGKMQTGDMGIFQITGQNSNEDYSWGGTFNTSSRDKSASITVRVEFTLD